MFFYTNEKSIINYSKRYSSKIEQSGVNLDEIKNSRQYSDLYNLLFESRNLNYLEGDTLYLEGTNPLVSFDYVYHAINKKTFRFEPWYIIMDQCTDFFELYNADVQDRSTFVAENRSINATDYVIPLFIIFLSCRNVFSKLTPSLFIHDGQIVFRFECDLTNIPNVFSIKKSPMYDLLINIFQLENKLLVNHILDDELRFEKHNTILTIRKQLYSVRFFDKKERIIKYIKAKKIVSAQELADYFKVSKRMINYYISDLIDEGIIVRIGFTNSSNARYKINSESYLF